MLIIAIALTAIAATLALGLFGVSGREDENCQRFNLAYTLKEIAEHPATGIEFELAVRKAARDAIKGVE